MCLPESTINTKIARWNTSHMYAMWLTDMKSHNNYDVTTSSLSRLHMLLIHWVQKISTNILCHSNIKRFPVSRSLSEIGWAWPTLDCCTAAECYLQHTWPFHIFITLHVAVRHMWNPSTLTCVYCTWKQLSGLLTGEAIGFSNEGRGGMLWWKNLASVRDG